MISPFEIYVVLQMDDVKNALAGLTGLTGLSATIAGLAAAIEGEHSYFDDKDDRDRKANFRRAAVKHCKLILAGAVLSASAAVLLPSTKTLAAMLVIPAVMKNEVVQQEASELYTMAKEALRDSLEPEKSK